MKKVTLSLDSSLKEIFTYEESRAVFDKFLPLSLIHIYVAACKERCKVADAAYQNTDDRHTGHTKFFAQSGQGKRDVYKRQISGS